MLELLRQPMCQFLIGGGLIFGLYQLVSGGTTIEHRPETIPWARPDYTIVVARGRMESLAAQFAARWQRSPTADELAALAADHVREEVLVREAVALGLDKDDPVIRRHLRTRMEFVVQDIGGLVEPTDQELEEFLRQHPESFRPPPVLSFRHVFLDREKLGEPRAWEVATDILRQLRASDIVAEETGDRFLLGHAFPDVALTRIELDFGSAFARDLRDAPVGAWSGPYLSTYGLHLVLVDARDQRPMPTLEQIRVPLRAAFEARRRRDALDEFMRRSLERYTISVETPATRQ